MTERWTEDGDSVARNTALLEEYARILADISTAATTCARAINALMAGAHLLPVEAIPAAAFTSADAQMPWGSPVVEDRNCLESVGHGAHTFGSEFVEGIGMLVVGYNPETDDWWTRAGYGQAWGGLGDLVGSLAVVGAPAAWLAATAMAVTGNTDSEFAVWMDERVNTLRNAGGSLVGWDPAAEDGWHRWKEDGIAAGTAVTLNVGTFFIPVAGQISAGLKAGSIGARVARIAGAGAELAVQGGSWAVRGSVKLVTGVRTAVARFDLDGLVTTTRAGQVVDAATGMRLNPGGLVNAMTDVSHATPRAPSHTPLGEALFGRDAAPDLDTGARTAPDGPHPTHDGQSPPASGEAPAVRDSDPAGLAQDGAAPAPESPHAPGEDGSHPEGHPDNTEGPSEPSDSPGTTQSSDALSPANSTGDEILDGGADSGSGWERRSDQPIDPHYGQSRHAGTDPPTFTEPPEKASDDVRALGGDVDHPWGTDSTTGQLLTRSEWAARYVTPDGNLRWPDNAGAVPGTKVVFNDAAAFTAAFGARLDRVGEPTGYFLGVPPGTPWEQRSITPDTLGGKVFGYALDPTAASREGLQIHVSRVAPAFGQPGGGIQVQFLSGHAELTVNDLIAKGILQ